MIPILQVKFYHLQKKRILVADKMLDLVQSRKHESLKHLSTVYLAQNLGSRLRNKRHQSRSVPLWYTLPSAFRR